MDEQTARTKWCPMVRLIITGFGITSNRTENIEPEMEHRGMCAASKCALWTVDIPEQKIKGNLKPAQGHCGLGR